MELEFKVCYEACMQVFNRYDIKYIPKSLENLLAASAVFSFDPDGTE